MVGYNRRFSPLSVSLRQVFATRADPLAMVYRINAGAVAATEWVQDSRVGGGRLIGECGHFVDLLAFVCGSHAVAVSGAAIGTPEQRQPDVLTITLEFANGSLGTIHYFSNGHPSLPKEQLEVFGGGVAAQLLNFRTLRVSGAKAGGKTRYFNQAKGFAEEARAVIDALGAGASAPIPFAALYNTSRATFEAERAMTSGARIAL
jgi:predicted dehydrogenase